MGISILKEPVEILVPLEGEVDPKKSQKKQKQQKTPDVGADKPKTKKIKNKKKKKDDDLISVKTGGYLKKRVYGAKLGEKIVADCYKNGKSK